MIVSVVAITLKSNQKIILDAASGGLREEKAMADLTWSGDVNSTGRQLRGHELTTQLRWGNFRPGRMARLCSDFHPCAEGSSAARTLPAASRSGCGFLGSHPKLRVGTNSSLAGEEPEPRVRLEPGGRVCVTHQPAGPLRAQCMLRMEPQVTGSVGGSFREERGRPRSRIFISSPRRRTVKLRSTPRRETRKNLPEAVGGCIFKRRLPRNAPWCHVFSLPQIC